MEVQKIRASTVPPTIGGCPLSPLNQPQKDPQQFNSFIRRRHVFGGQQWLHVFEPRDLSNSGGFPKQSCLRVAHLSEVEQTADFGP